MQKTTRLQRLLAVIVAVFMAVCCLPLNAFAEEGSVANVKLVLVDESTGTELETQEVQVIEGQYKYEKLYLMADTSKYTADYDISSNNEQGDVYVADGARFVINLTPKAKVANIKLVLVDESTGTELETQEVQVIEGQYKYEKLYLMADTSKYAADYDISSNNEQGDVYVADGARFVINLTPKTKDVIVNVQFKDGDEVVAGGDYFVPAGVQKFSVLEKYLPEGYVLADAGDFLAVDGAKVTVAIEKVTKEVIMNIQFKDGDEVVAGGDYFVPAGVQNYSVLKDYVPEGYVLEDSGDFMAAEGGKLIVAIKKVTDEVIMNILFKDGDEVVAGGDYFVPAGVQNYSALQSYVPEGYVLEVSGDFMAAEGAKLDVPVKKITNEVIMNIQFKDGDEVVAGGDYFVPAGVQNYNVLGKYVPAGYSMDVSGDFMAAEGAKLEVPVSKIENAVIMNIRFIDSTTDEFVAGGDYFLPAGVQNYKVLTQYVPEGYKMDVSGDFTVAEGTSLDVPVTKLPAQIIMNIRFMEGETFIAGGDYFVTEGVNNYSVLTDLGYLPEGYEMDVAGDFMAKESAKLEVPVHKIKDESGESEDSTSNSDNTTTVSSDNNNNTKSSSDNQVVKAEAPADNTAKVMPQTGLTAEAPVVFGVMMFAALAGAGAYLFAIRKKLN